MKNKKEVTFTFSLWHILHCMFGIKSRKTKNYQKISNNILKIMNSDQFLVTENIRKDLSFSMIIKYKRKILYMHLKLPKS